MKILILKPSSLGDVVQALPVLRLLKHQDPTREIHWWLGADLVPLLAGDPDLAGIFPFERRRWASPWRWHEVARSVRQIRASRFDWVIDLQGLARSGLLAWCASGQLTIGLDDAREGAPAFYDLRVRRPSANTHAVDWYLEVLRTLGIPVHRNFTWLPPRPETQATLQHKWPIAGRRWLVLHPGARWSNKRWPVEHFRQLVERIAAVDPGLHFAILGSAGDTPLGERIAGGAPDRCLVLTGRTSLPEMIEWIRLSALMVTNDTGPMHVAAALDKPVVALFGPTDPRRTGPYGQIDHVLREPPACAPCLRAACHYEKPLACLVAIRPETVSREVLSRLNGAGTTNRPAPWTGSGGARAGSGQPAI